MFNWWSFYMNGEELAKVPLAATGACTYTTCSVTQSDFVLFAEQELSWHFCHPIFATIQLLVAGLATHFAYLRSFVLFSNLQWLPN